MFATNVNAPIPSIGINTPPNIPQNDIKIDETGPACFSLLQSEPISTPALIKNSIDGIKYITAINVCKPNGKPNITPIHKNITV